MDNSLLTTLSHQVDITQLMSQFGMMVDTRNWKGFESLFADSVVFDYSDIGDIAATLHPKEIASNAEKSFSGFEATQHVITNHQIEIVDRETATCKAYVRAMHKLPNEQGEALLEIGGKYEASLLYSGSHWKISSWKFTAIWSRGNENLFELAKK